MESSGRVRDEHPPEGKDIVDGPERVDAPVRDTFDGVGGGLALAVARALYLLAARYPDEDADRGEQQPRSASSSRVCQRRPDDLSGRAASLEPLRLPAPRTVRPGGARATVRGRRR